ncbi:hypothetical protein HJC23_009831 [Cyclotella cryptica]|uniref:Membrane insertase YidC/Oxa/ALB C-terminal domain-containing protein n=1 Tax=Cyclotella cryptica TaxID=29204 RepID=A0ABD3NVE9_9STRA|eukprot:CCRYP_019930-RA/>CCRYP_019930-RA protein AED:0.26 eAED:0.26 QI:0/-1/0/1/-1/1/1/0/424
MIRSTARQLFVSCQRGGRTSNASSPLSSHLIYSCAGAVTSHDRLEVHEPSTSRHGFCTLAPLTPTWPNQRSPLALSSALVPRRHMSSGSSPQDLPGFGSNPITPEDDAETAIASALDAADLAATALPFEPTWWPSDQVLLLLNFIHENVLPGYPYAVTIGATTLAFRVLLFPLFAKGQRNSSRMVHLNPELKQLKEQLDKMGNRVDQQTQMRYMQQTRALFKKYDCNPMLGLVAPLVSAPFFISMFFGLKNAPDYFPEVMREGGMWWFMDLTQPDPYVVLPVVSALTFLGLTEVGKEQMMGADPATGRVMVNTFRALAIVMVPMTMNFNSGVFVYWTVNNTFSFCQTLLFKNPSVKNALGIWDPPKPVPGQETKNIIGEVKRMMERKEENVNALAAERIQAHNELIEKQKKVRKIMEKSGNQKR